MDDINVGLLINQLKDNILKSGYREKNLLIEEIDSVFQTYSQSDENSDDFPLYQDEDFHLRSKFGPMFKNRTLERLKYKKYQDVSLERLAFLLTVYDLFFLSRVLAVSTINLMSSLELQSVKYENGIELGIETDISIDIEPFENIGNLLFPSIFNINDFHYGPTK